MSTNGIIARSTGEGTFAGRYHHWDSYPSGLGVALVEAYRGYFKNDLTRMLQVLLDEHTGWSTIVGKDFTLRPGWTCDRVKAPSSTGLTDAQFHEAYAKYKKQPDVRRPQCYCHGDRNEESFVANEKSDCGAQWAYVFDETDKILHVCERTKHEVSQEYFWLDVGRIELDAPDEIPWTEIECGKDFERCSHMVLYHFPKLKHLKLGMQTFLGNRPLDFHDVVGFILPDKRRVHATGSGGNSSYLNQHGKRFPRDTWVATVKFSNGKTTEIPVAKITKDGHEPLPGVTWIFPPTKTNPNETQRSL